MKSSVGRVPRRAMAIIVFALMNVVVVAGSPAAVAAAVPDPIDNGAMATCKFTVIGHVFDPDVNPYNELAVGRLKRIVVTPPTMYGLLPFDAPVSWRFAVYKVWDWYNGGKWKVTYVSPQQHGSASPSTPADFHKMVFRPRAPIGDDTTNQSKTSYRVELRMTWWNPDSPVIISKLSYLFTELHQTVDGVPTDNIQMCYYRELLPGSF